MAQWYARYNTGDNNKVLEAGFVDETERARWVAMSGMNVTVGFTKEIPNLIDINGMPQYRYNTDTEQIEAL